jgi:hypothetical protein
MILAAIRFNEHLTRRALSQRAIQDVAEVEPLSEAVRREREEAWN